MRHADSRCTYIEAVNPHRYIYTGPCYYTGLPYTVTIPAEELFAYREGALAQDAFKSLSKGDREFLISGTTPAGWFLLWDNDDSPRNTLIILQGPPGSGKSCVARKLMCEIINAVIVSTDERHYDEAGNYVFQPEKIGEYHQATQQKAMVLLAMGCTVIVDNTNILNAHIKPYVQMAEKFKVPVRFIRVDGEHQNSHGVPPETVEKMRAAMEELSVEKALNSPGLGGKRE